MILTAETQHRRAGVPIAALTALMMLIYAFENHDHVYKRSFPLRANKRDPNGIVYMGDGAWGAGAREIGRDHEQKDIWYLEKAAATNHAILVTLVEGEAHLRVIDREGRIIDEYANRESVAADR